MTRIGLYAGTFDPIHNGHVDVIRRSFALVDKLVIGVAINSGKGPLFSLEERIEMIKEEAALVADGAEVVVHPYSGLTVTAAKDVGATIVLRGLRAVADFEFEYQLTVMNKHLDHNIETVFLMADARHQALASRLIKEIATLGGDVSPFVPEGVKRRLLEKVTPR